MRISADQYNKLPNEYKQYFIKVGGDASSGERINVHPT